MMLQNLPRDPISNKLQRETAFRTTGIYPFNREVITASKIAPVATIYNETSENNEVTKDNEMEQSNSTPSDNDAEESTLKQTDHHVPETQPEVHASAVST